MKISRERLLQIIKEEVELYNHSGEQKPNTITHPDSRDDMFDIAEKNGDGKISKSEADDALEKAKKESGVKNEDLNQECGMEEDALYSHEKVKDPETGKISHPKIEPNSKKNSRSILSVKFN